MGRSLENNPPQGSNAVRSFPAYGPIEAALGYGLFYVLVGRVTPAVLDVFSETVLDLPAPFVGFGLAVALWFVLAVTVLDQIRRQLAGLGIGSQDSGAVRVWSRLSPGPIRTGGYVLAVVAGGVIAWSTFDRAVDALLSLIPAISTVAVSQIDLQGFFVLVLFFLSYSVAAHALDRLVIGAIKGENLT